MKPVHLFVRFPFCDPRLSVDSRPLYTGSREQMQAYLDAVLREAETAAPDFEDSGVRSLHIGGGYPLLLDADAWHRMIRELKRLFAFSEQAEISMDALPSQLNASWMVRFQHLGVNRLRIDLVSGRAGDYEALGLPGNPGTAQTALILPQVFHLPHYAVRILYGLPGQTPEQFLVSTRFCCKFHAKEIHFRPFREPAHEAWRKLALASQPVPDKEQAAAIKAAAGEHLLKKGYEEYLPDRFALPGYRSAAEAAATGGEELLSLGVGTRSRTDGVVYQTTGTLERYLSCSAEPEKLYTVLGKTE